MKQYYSLALSLLLLCILNSSYSQVCTVDYSYTQPGVYPDTLPTGYVSNAYSEDVTFVMILDTMGATITNFQIVNIALPVGLSWDCDNSSGGCNYNPQSNIYGCINIFGTPLLAGNYDVEVSILCDVIASGQTINNIPISFYIFMEVGASNPGSGNSGFSMSASSGCFPVSIDFTNNNPGLFAYNWDFGNGNSSNQENPSTQEFNAPGEYIIFYEGYPNLDTIDVYTLTSVTIEDVTEDWTGAPWGWEIFNGNQPDPYFILYENGNLIYQSNYQYNNSGPITWTMNINLDPNKTYEISVFDADESAAQDDVAEFSYGSDDFIGAHNINLNGCNNCSAGNFCDIAYTTDYLQILPTPSVQSIDTIEVFGYPGQPNISYDAAQYVLSTDSTQYGLQWYANDTIMAGHTFSTDTISFSGYYHVVAFNNFGCGSSSDTIFAAYCDTNFPAPIIDINPTLELYTTAPSGWNFQWNNNNQPIAGADSNVYFPSGSGNYSVTIINPDGCSYTSSNYVYSVGIENFTDNLWSVFPNPSSGIVTITYSSSLSTSEIYIHNLIGKNIATIQHSESNSPTLDLYHLPSGIYLLSINTNKGILTKTITLGN